MKPDEVAALIPLALRIARRLAAARGMPHYADELEGVACGGLARALAAYDPDIGPIKAFAAQWIAGAVHEEIDKEERRASVETAFGAPDATHPALRAEELARDIVDAALSSYADEELRSNGEVAFFREETRAALHRELDRLEQADRTLVRLRYWERHTWKQVGEALGIAERTAQDHDARIRARLHEALIAWDRVTPIRRTP